MLRKHSIETKHRGTALQVRLAFYLRLMIHEKGVKIANCV